MTHPFCTITASTKRNQDLDNGITGNPVTYLATLAVTPLWSLRPETIESLGISSPREFKECFAVPNDDTLADVVEGDVLVHSGTEYIVDNVAEWPDLSGGVPCLHLVVQEVKTSWPKVTVP